MRASVLFVCLGNICRSPVAHRVLLDEVERRGLDVHVDSCGTGPWHVGEGANPPMIEACKHAGIDLRSHVARQLQPADRERFQLVIAMDRQNERDILARCTTGTGAVRTFMSFVPEAAFPDVPDPWGGPRRGFDEVIDLVRRGTGPILDLLLKSTAQRG